MKTTFRITADGLNIQRGDDDPLEASIRKWETIVNACRKGYTINDGGPGTCPLCVEYIENDYGEGRECEGCPIEEAGHQYCQDTPYDDYFRARKFENLIGCLNAAKREVEFLKNLQEISESD